MSAPKNVRGALSYVNGKNATSTAMKAREKKRTRVVVYPAVHLTLSLNSSSSSEQRLNPPSVITFSATTVRVTVRGF
jgi:hypothetical protein